MSSIDFSIANKDGKPVVYLGQAQTLTLTLTNSSGSDLQLIGSQPVQETDADGNTALVYLFLDKLVSDPALVQVSCPGWVAQFQTTSQGSAWCLAHTDNSVFKAGAQLALTLSGVTVEGQPGSRQASIDCWFSDDGDSAQLPVLAQNDPGKLIPLQIDFALNGGNVIYVTQDANVPMTCSLVFRLSNPSRTTPIVPADVPWGSEAPYFTLSFVYADKGDGYGALTSTERGAQIDQQTVQDYDNRWSIKQDTQGAPHWTLRPDQLKNKQILGINEHASFEFMLDNIITQLKPGTTLAYLQWSNIPGYQDGFTTVPLVKQVPKAGIISFMTLNKSVINQGTLVQLNWQSFALSRCTLTWKKDNTSYQRNVPTSASAYVPDPQPDDDVTYTLDGYDFNGNQVPNRQQTVSVIADAPVISDFSLTPRVAAFDGSNPNVAVTGTWQVTNPVNQVLNGTSGVSPLQISLNVPGEVMLVVTGHQQRQDQASQIVYSIPGYAQTFVSTSQVSGGSNGPVISNILTFNRDNSDGTGTGTWTLRRSDAVATQVIATQRFSWTTYKKNINLVFDDRSTKATLTCAFGTLTLTERSGSADQRGLQPLAMLVQNAAGQGQPVFSAAAS